MMENDISHNQVFVYEADVDQNIYKDLHETVAKYVQDCFTGVKLPAEFRRGRTCGKDETYLRRPSISITKEMITRALQMIRDKRATS